MTLELNSLGSNQARADYRAALVAYLEQHKELLDEDSLRRMYSNPLRVLDSKNPVMQEMLGKAPQLLDYLDAESKADFDGLQKRLKAAGVEFVDQPTFSAWPGLLQQNCLRMGHQQLRFTRHSLRWWSLRWFSGTAGRESHTCSWFCLRYGATGIIAANLRAIATSSGLKPTFI